MTRHLPPRKIKKPLRPGQFVYGSGMVFEIGNSGARHPRLDIKPESKGPWKHKHYVKPGA